MLGEIYDKYREFIDSFHKKAMPDKATRTEEIAIKYIKPKTYRLATHENDSEFLALFESVNHKFGFTQQPRVFIYDNGELNAYYSAESNSFHFSKQAIDQLTKDELESLMGHEVAHKTQRDVKLATSWILNIAELISAASATYFFDKKVLSKLKITDANSGFKEAINKGSEIVALVSVFSIAKMAFEYAVAPLYYAISRSNETKCDELSVSHVRKPKALISMDEKMEEHNNKLYKEWEQKHSKPIAPTDEDKSHIVLPDNKKDSPSFLHKKWTDMTDTHPEHTKRLEHIRKTAHEFGLEA